MIQNPSSKLAATYNDPENFRLVRGKAYFLMQNAYSDYCSAKEGERPQVLERYARFGHDLLVSDKERSLYAADNSADELEFFFTRPKLHSGPAIYLATRKSTSKPFGESQKIHAITGFAEAPSISPDGLSLYYHVRASNGVFGINRVTRTLVP